MLKYIWSFWDNIGGIYDLHQLKAVLNDPRFDEYFVKLFGLQSTEESIDKLYEDGNYSDCEMIDSILDMFPDRKFCLEYIDEKHGERFAVWEFNKKDFEKFVAENLDPKYLSEKFNNKLLAGKI